MESPRRTIRYEIDRGVDLLKKGDVKALYSLWHVYLNMDDASPADLDAEDRYWEAYALFHFAVALETYKYHAFALKVFSKCISRFAGDANEEIAHLVNQAFANAGMVACGPAALPKRWITSISYPPSRGSFSN
jgi:hypothetical protein